MSTLTLLTIRNLVRSELNESSTTTITDAELNSIINDGYKDTASKGLCCLSKVAKSNIPASVRFVSMVTSYVIKMNYIEYDLATSGCKGMLCVLPQAIGHIPINGNTPQFWFQWGTFAVIEPYPDVSTYDLNIYAACYPSAVLSADGDLPSGLPDEFHECVYLFTMAFACLKLKRWADAAAYYNKYIESVQMRRKEYVNPNIDYRYMHEIPASVTENERKS